MKPSKFDELTKALATATSRRQALKAIGAAVGGALGFSRIGIAFADQCKPLGASCFKDNQCCSGHCTSHTKGGGGTCVTPTTTTTPAPTTTTTSTTTTTTTTPACLPSGKPCTGNSQCCLGLCCNATCCHSHNATCCPAGSRSSCCAAGSYCCNSSPDGCCPLGRGCAGAPCSTGSDCCSGSCQPLTLRCY
jgi:hypothetical protein